MRNLDKGKPEEKYESRTNDPLTDLALWVVFLLGGVYMILAFSSFFIFLIRFGCALFGASSLTNSGHGESLGIPSRTRRTLPSPETERELLNAVKENASGISPTEAAIETSLTAREADEILSGLASQGYLEVESENGTLFYSIPKRRT